MYMIVLKYKKNEINKLNYLLTYCYGALLMVYSILFYYVFWKE